MGSILVFVGSIALISFAMIGLYLDILIVEGLAGFWASVAAFAFFPLTLIVVPWYALLAHGSLVPMAICYGGVMCGALVLTGGLLLKASLCEVRMPSSSAYRYDYVSNQAERKSLEGSI